MRWQDRKWAEQKANEFDWQIEWVVSKMGIVLSKEEMGCSGRCDAT